MIIKNITAKKIIASMGDFTVEATIEFADGKTSTASVPAGISAGKYEIKKVDADQATLQIHAIADICDGKDWTQETLDKEISSHDFGGNATLAVSAAMFKTNKITAASFPKLMLLLFEGAEHGNKNITIQEFMIVEDTLEQAMRDFRTLKESMEDVTVGAEGGYSPKNYTNEKVLEKIKSLFSDRKIAIDMASCFGKSEIPEGVFSVEDPYDDESWDKFSQLTALKKFLVIGDDLTATNPERIKTAIEKQAIDAVVIKPNQIGTITAAMEAVKIARDGGLKIVVSHRGEETSDYWIADFAVAVGADYVKLGGMDRGERIAKYNRLIELGMR